MTRAQYDKYKSRDEWLKSGEHTYEEVVHVTWKRERKITGYIIGIRTHTKTELS